MGGEYKVECEECDEVTIVLVDTHEIPCFCSMCGRRNDYEKIELDVE
tara:strand:- start:303 stop:443 length:141 start_codon:yes stop_codon:yes gene_type:complete